MKPRDSALRLKRFEATEKARKVASIETMISDFEHVAVDLARQIAAEEERTGIEELGPLCIFNLCQGSEPAPGQPADLGGGLRVKLEAARAAHADVMSEIGRLEPVETREVDRQVRKADHPGAVIG